MIGEECSQGPFSKEAFPHGEVDTSGSMMKTMQMARMGTETVVGGAAEIVKSASTALLLPGQFQRNGWERLENNH